MKEDQEGTEEKDCLTKPCSASRPGGGSAKAERARLGRSR
jgi:hypothetical protein